MKKNYLFPLLAWALISQNTHAQEKTQTDSLSYEKTEILEEIIVRSVRANSKTPITFSNLDKKEIQKRNLGQDIPVLMNFMPSVVTTTDAGNGIGYTGIRVRGSDATRVNVTLNGIAYNDSESHGTFWVNMPDFASSLQNLQLQRGVGTSTNGAGAFGASLNLLTDAISYNAYGEIANSLGSFNSRKHTVKFSTGLLGDSFELQGRLSKINSDGYIDRAWSDMKGYFFQGTFVNKATLIKGIAFGGDQQTYQAWNGIEKEDLEKYGRRHNTSGLYYDEDGNIKYYDNETDNYKQHHYQLHWNEKWNSQWNTNLALHYTRGLGYYENYKRKQKLQGYNLQHETVKTTDLIRRKHLDNHFYGTTFSIHYNQDDLEVIVGGAANEYKGDHFGEILWTKENINHQYKQHYYFDSSEKRDINAYAKATWTINKWNVFADMQWRNLQYKANGVETGLVNDNFEFFNPKAGITYNISDRQQMYFSYAKAHREPNRDDYENGNPKPEKLNDFEAGWRYNNKKYIVNINAYYMRYKDQLVLTGALNDVGAPIRANSGDSYRAGIEIDAQVPISKKWIISPNMTISQNRNIDFKEKIDGEIKELGNTPIAFSPNFISGIAINYLPIENLQISWLTKIVGEQYMGNTKSTVSKLDSYYTNDLVMQYSLQPNKFFKEINFNLMLNNIFDVKYISNGYYYTYENDWSVPGTIITEEGAGYYPQARFNFLAGVSLKF